MGLRSDLREGERRVGSSDAVVASQSCLESSSKTGAIDSGDFGLACGGFQKGKMVVLLDRRKGGGEERLPATRRLNMFWPLEERVWNVKCYNNE